MTNNNKEMWNELSIRIITIEVIDIRTGAIISRSYEKKHKWERAIDQITDRQLTLFNNQVKIINQMRLDGKISDEQALAELRFIQNRIRRLLMNRRME